MRNSRLAAIHNLLARGPFTHIVLSDLCDIEYLTGFRSSNAYCVVSKRANTLCSDFRYREAALAFCKRRREWKFLEIKGSDLSFLRGPLGRSCVAGIQSNVITVDTLGRMKRSCPGVRFVKLPETFGRVFIPKTEREIESMRNAAAIGDRAFADMVGHARPGITERELALFCEDRCRKYGSERPSFDTIVLFGRRAALPHGVPSNVRLASGDWVLCDFGCTVDGLASDMTRTFVIGKASAKQKQLYDVVLRAQETARRAVAAGQRACDIDKLARDAIEAAGYGPLFGHATGHGVGLRVHENPRIACSDKSILQEGTVITIEPGIYHPRFGGVRIEDMVVVREGGGETITGAPRELMQAGLK
jgi:Xaa-Pro aminopeptidase